jgi:peptide/nickel transport system substrate-binding protein
MILRRAFAPALTALLVLVALPPRADAAPEGQLTWGVHITLAPTWFDPAEMPGMITPFMVLYALHDAMVKPMPAGPQTPSLAESWTVAKDGSRTSSSCERTPASTTARRSPRRT